MPAIKYGKKEIIFSHQIDEKLKDGYISVDAEEGVVFRSPPLDEFKVKELVRNKAAWIVKKLKLVQNQEQERIVTGSRLPYLGKTYYTEIIENEDIPEAKVYFTHSKIKIFINAAISNKEQAIILALEEFYRNKAAEKIVPRIKRWIKITNLEPADFKFRKLNKRWGSCTRNNTIFFNYDAVKLPCSLIDYVIVHELCHIRIKQHSKAFWNLVSKFLANFQDLENRIVDYKLQI